MQKNAVQNYWKRVSPFLIFSRILEVSNRKLNKFFRVKYQRAIYEQKEKFLGKWLRSKLSDTISTFSTLEETAEPFKTPEQAPIWMCWLQGVDKLPPMLKQCLRTIEKHKGKHPLYFLDEGSISRFITIPASIQRLYENGEIPPAHYVDFVRICLLEQYGGVWIDATVILTKDIDDEMFEHPYWSAKGMDPRFPLEPTVPFGTEWESYFIAAQPHALFYKYLKTLFLEYFSKYDFLVDYYIFNYFAQIARNSSPTLLSEFHSVPSNNTWCELLQAKLASFGAVRSITVQEMLIESKTYMYKLTRNNNWEEDEKSRRILNDIWRILL